MGIVLQGILVGLILMLFTGPSFFYLLKVSIERGFSRASGFALGIILSDLFIVIMVYQGFSKLFKHLLFQEIFSLVAGVVILGLGIYTLLSPQKQGADIALSKARIAPYKYILKGFAFNVINPFTFIVWVTVLGGASLKYNYQGSDFLTFFGAIMGTVLLTDILKAYGANQIGKLLNPRMLARVARILGVIFIALGLRLLFYFYTLITEGVQEIDLDVLG